MRLLYPCSSDNTRKENPLSESYTVLMPIISGKRRFSNSYLNSISRSQIQRLKTGNVNVNTLNNILNVLEDCTLDDICEFTPDKTGKEDEE